MFTQHDAHVRPMQLVETLFGVRSTSAKTQSVKIDTKMDRRKTDPTNPKISSTPSS
jgi:hypothetical protein